MKTLWLILLVLLVSLIAWYLTKGKKRLEEKVDVRVHRRTITVKGHTRRRAKVSGQRKSSAKAQELAEEAEFVTTPVGQPEESSTPVGGKLGIPSFHRKSSKEIIVTSRFLRQETKMVVLTTSLSAISAVVYTTISASNLVEPTISPYYLGLMMALIVSLSLLRWGILYYRIHKGYYGNNQHEAKEIISFIRKKADDL